MPLPLLVNYNAGGLKRVTLHLPSQREAPAGATIYPPDPRPDQALHQVSMDSLCTIEAEHGASVLALISELQSLQLQLFVLFGMDLRHH